MRTDPHQTQATSTDSLPHIGAHRWFSKGVIMWLNETKQEHDEMINKTSKVFSRAHAKAFLKLWTKLNHVLTWSCHWTKRNRSVVEQLMRPAKCFEEHMQKHFYSYQWSWIVYQTFIYASTFLHFLCISRLSWTASIRVQAAILHLLFVLIYFLTKTLVWLLSNVPYMRYLDIHPGPRRVLVRRTVNASIC